MALFKRQVTEMVHRMFMERSERCLRANEDFGVPFSQIIKMIFPEGADSRVALQRARRSRPRNHLALIVCNLLCYFPFLFASPFARGECELQWCHRRYDFCIYFALAVVLWFGCFRFAIYTSSCYPDPKVFRI